MTARGVGRSCDNRIVYDKTLDAYSLPLASSAPQTMAGQKKSDTYGQARTRDEYISARLRDEPFCKT